MEGTDTAVDRIGSRFQQEADISVTYGVGKVNKIKRKYILLSGREPNNLQFIVHNNTLVNVMRALVERVFYVERQVNGIKTLAKPPTTSRAYFNEQMSEFSSKLREYLPYVARMSLQQFVETSPAHKMKVYLNGMVDYLREGLSPKQSQVTSFCKAEKQRITEEKSDPAPRIIQPRGVIFNLIFGCFIRPAEKLIYAAIDRVYGRPTVCCGQNAEQMAAMLWDAWCEITDPVAISLDLSRMDQHVSVAALRWEHGFYRHIYQHDPCYETLDWCLQSTINNEGRAYVTTTDGRPAKVKYHKTGSRMSGDMNTSLGNKLIMCGLLYSYYKTVCGFEPRVDFNVVDNGDDCVVILSKKAYGRYQRQTEFHEVSDRVAVADPANWSNVWLSEESYRFVPPRHMPVDQWFNSMGFTLKVEGIVTKFNHIEFCQTQPCFIDGRWIMVRGLKALAKDAVCLKPLNVLDKWMSQVKGGGLVTYGSVPIFSAYYQSLPGDEAKDRKLLKGTGMYYLSKGMSSGRTITDQNRVEFWETFGVTPREQEVIENAYLSLQQQQVALETWPSLMLPLPVI
jgi:hypothetical protein